jgi:6-methylsalicylate decarboxylase
MSNFIDVHHHSFNPKYREALAKYGYDNVGGIAPPQWNAEIAGSQMSNNGIRAAVTSVSAPGVHFGDDAEARSLARHCNEFSAELVKDNPSQFGFFAVLPMPDVQGTLEEIAYAFDVLGDDGVVLMSSHLDGSYLGDPRFDEVMEELNRRNAIAFIHPQVPSTGIAPAVDIPVFAMDFTFDTTRAAFNLVWRGTVEKYQSIRFILAHAGGTVPYLAWRFNLLWAPNSEVMQRAPRGALHYLKQFYYDTALSPTATTLGSLMQLVDIDHILFGSDFPFAPEMITTISVQTLKKSELLSAEQLNVVLEESALALFPRFAR